MPTLATIQTACESLGHAVTEDRGQPPFIVFQHEGDPVFGVTTHHHFALPPNPDLDAVAAWVEQLHREAEEHARALAQAEEDAAARA